ncbi:MAG: Flp pilus assembly protein CpaB [Steroidobacteraceae bacterium]|jgi:pilus assembly protein CpaB
MKAARLVVLGIALAAGGVAAFLANGIRQQQAEPAKTVVVEPKTVQVLVAKADLGRAKVIGEQDIGWQAWPIDSATPTLIQKSERPDAMHQFVGAMVRVPIANGEPVHEAAVVFAKSGGFMAAVLRPGMRAVSLEISPDSAAGGSILPDDNVDVILTPAQKAPGENFHSETILRNVRVLAVGQKSVTIELAPQQVETFAAARQTGTLSLALRSLADPDQANSYTGDLPNSINVVRYGMSTSASTRGLW